MLSRKRGLVVNHKRVRRLLHELGWVQPRFRGGRPIRPPWPTAPTGSNQVWLIDMTKIGVTDTGWLHHIAIIDAYTREIVGHHESLRARAQEWLEAFNQAILERFPEGTRGLGLVIQADNGSQPTARAFREALQTCGVGLAFIDVAEPKQNAIIERFFRFLKEEEVWPNLYDTVAEAKRGIADYVRVYNHEREHSSLGYVPPVVFGQQAAQDLRGRRQTSGLSWLRDVFEENASTLKNHPFGTARWGDSMIHWADPLDVTLFWLVWAVGISLLAPGILTRPWVGAVLGAGVAGTVVQEPVAVSVLWIVAGFVLGLAAGRILADPMERLGLHAGVGALGADLRNSLSEGGWRAYRLAVAAYGLLLLVSWLGLRTKAVPLGTFGGWDLIATALQFFGTRRAPAGMSPQQIHDFLGGRRPVDVWSWIEGSIHIFAAVWISAAALGSFDRAVRGQAVDLKLFAQAGNRWFWRYLLWSLAVGTALVALTAAISLPTLLLYPVRGGQLLTWRFLSTTVDWFRILVQTGFLVPAMALLVLRRPLILLLRRRWRTLLVGGLIATVAGSLSYGSLLVYPAWTLYVVALSEHELEALGEEGGGVGPGTMSKVRQAD